MNLKIHTKEDPILRKKNSKIKNPTDPKIQSLIASMLETMRANNGLGLAAPQVGKNLRICVIEENGDTLILINPQITAKSKNRVLMEEGCLSFPGEFFHILRPEEVKVRYLDEKGINKKLKSDGLLGRALQHEIDHLDGILITDRLKKSRKNQSNTKENESTK